MVEVGIDLFGLLRSELAIMIRINGQVKLVISHPQFNETNQQI